MPIVITKASDEDVRLKEKRKKRKHDLLKEKLKQLPLIRDSDDEGSNDRDKILRILYSSGSEDDSDNDDSYSGKRNNNKSSSTSAATYTGIDATKSSGNSNSSSSSSSSSAKLSNKNAYLSSDMEDLISLAAFRVIIPSTTNIINGTGDDGIKTKLIGDELFYTTEEKYACFSSFASTEIKSNKHSSATATTTTNGTTAGPAAGIVSPPMVHRSADKHNNHNKSSSHHDQSTEETKPILVQLQEATTVGMKANNRKGSNEFYNRISGVSDKRITQLRIGKSMNKGLVAHEKSAEDTFKWAVAYAKNHADILNRELQDINSEVERYNAELNMTEKQRKQFKHTAAGGKQSSPTSRYSRTAKAKLLYTKDERSTDACDRVTELANQLDKAFIDNKEAFIQSIMPVGGLNRTLTSSSSVSYRPSPPHTLLPSKRRNSNTNISSSASLRSVRSNALTNSNKNIDSATATATATSSTIAVPTVAATLVSDNDTVASTSVSSPSKPAFKPKPPSARKTATAAAAATDASSRVQKKVTKYSNTTQSENVSDDLQAAMALQLLLKKKFKLKFGGFDVISDRIDALSNKTDKKVSRCYVKSSDIIDQVTAFYHNQSILNGEATQMYDEIDYHWVGNMKEKLQCFSLHGHNGDALIKRSLRSNMEIAHNQAEVTHKTNQLANISKATWLLTILTKLKEYMKKSSSKHPISCFQYLSVIRHIIASGISLTHQLFYRVIEAIIVEKDDHKDVIVHKAIKATRDVLNISAEYYLKYLESKGISPCQALLVQIRQNKKKRLRKEKLNAQRKSKLASLNRLNSSSSGLNIHNSQSQSDISRQNSSHFMHSRQNSRLSMMSDSEYGDGVSDYDMTSNWDMDEDGSELGDKFYF